MGNKPTLKIALKSLLLLSKDFRDNIPLFLVLLSIFGGLGQFIRLYSISPRLLSLFSTSQVIIDGLLFLIYFALTLIISLILLIVYFSSFGHKITDIVIKLCVFSVFLYINFISQIWLPSLLGIILIMYIFILDLYNYLFTERKIENTLSHINPYSQFLLLFIINYISFYQYYYVEIYYNGVDEKIFVKNIPSNLLAVNSHELKPNKDDELNVRFYYLNYINDKYAIYLDENEKICIIRNTNEILSTEEAIYYTK